MTWLFKGLRQVLGGIVADNSLADNILNEFSKETTSLFKLSMDTDRNTKEC